jgi:hypothetical protein
VISNTVEGIVEYQILYSLLFFSRIGNYQNQIYVIKKPLTPNDNLFTVGKKVVLKHVPKIAFNDMSGQKQSKNYTIPE